MPSIRIQNFFGTSFRWIRRYRLFSGRIVCSGGDANAYATNQRNKRRNTKNATKAGWDRQTEVPTVGKMLPARDGVRAHRP